MKNFSRMLCLILCFALVLGQLPLGFAAEHPFVDVPEGCWYDEAVQFVYENGLMNGTSATTFSPELHMSRGMIVTVLYRLEGSPETSGQMPFEDVPAKYYYHDAIAWSYENGIVNGVSGTQFAPDADVTREQLVTIFYRYANAKGYGTVGMGDLENSRVNHYRDVDDLSNYARNAMVWAEGRGIIKGMTDTTLEPQGSANRAQFATIMKRFADWCENRNAPATVLTAEKDAQLHENLQNAIDGILYSETQIVHSDTFIPGKTYTGTAYYFSNDGDDYLNDGLSPESPWQSVGKMIEILDSRNGQVLKPGDAVFLRRGDTFRLPNWAMVVSVEGVTISAYGEGDKPIVTASSENGSGKDKWKLVYEDDTGKKIWQFYKDVRDTSMVIFNDGEAVAQRVYEYYDGTKYISLGEQLGWQMHDGFGVLLLDRLLSLEESLTEDMTIISRCFEDSDLTDDVPRGPLYLRCDEGNPGSLYNSIEFTELEACANFWLSASDTVLDNLSIRCNGNSYIKAGVESWYWADLENTLIQNCEFAYGGGSAYDYGEIGDTGTYFIGTQGDGIYNVIKNTTIRNNYFHDSMCSTVAFEWALDDERTSDGYYHVLDNVMVNTQGINCNTFSPSLKYLDSMIVRGNQIWNTGYWDNGKFSYSGGSHNIVGNYFGEYIVENNVFYGTEISHKSNALLTIEMYSPREDIRNPNETIPMIRNNVYVQHSGRKMGYFPMWWIDPDDRSNVDVFIDDPDLKTKVAEITGDTTSEFYVIETTD